MAGRLGTRLLFYKVLRLLVVRQLERQLVFTIFISNNRASLHLWWGENLVKHQKSENIMKIIVASKHFNQHNHDFNSYGKFIIIEQLKNIFPTTTKTLKERLKQSETWDFSLIWSEEIPKLKPCYAEFITTFFYFCIWFLKTNVSRKMTSNTLHYL